MTAVPASVSSALDELREAGLYKRERKLQSPQDSRIKIDDAGSVLNLCANNYLGLANHPEIVQAAHEALDRWGYGLASVRFICGTQSCHKELEAALSSFWGWRTQSSTPPASMPMAGCSKRSSALKTP
jgi:glycine C-acetyltransferase